MIKKYLLQTYIYLYYIMQLLWARFFGLVNKFIMVYSYENDALTNVTMNYYLGLVHKKSTYYVKIFDKNGINHIAFNGCCHDLRKIPFIDTNQKLHFKRKNILLLADGAVSNVNLDILDNYRKNLQIYAEKAVVDLDVVLKILNIKCSDVKIISMSPFKILSVPVAGTDINSIYWDE